MELNLDDFKTCFDMDFIYKKKEKLTLNSGKTVNVVTFKYHYWDGKEFNTNYDLLKECRGISFDLDTGKLLSLGLHKFFNYMEPFGVQNTLTPDEFSTGYTFTKLDGSCVIPTLFEDGTILLKTGKGFLTEVAISATKNFPYRKFVEWLDSVQQYAIFEYISHINSVVVKYNNNTNEIFHNFVCTRIRKKDGSYVNELDFAEICKEWEIPTPDFHKFNSVDEVLEFNKDVTNFEGFIWSKGNKFIKFKSDWYNANHRINTNLRERDVYEAFFDNTIDDLKSQIIILNQYDISPVLDIENILLGKIKEAEKEIKHYIEMYKSAYVNNYAEFHKKIKHSIYCGIVMTKIRREDYDYVDDMLKVLKKELIPQSSLLKIYWK